MVCRTVIIAIGFSVIFAGSAAAQSNTDQGGVRACDSTVFSVWDAGGGTEVSIADCGDKTPCGTITNLADPDLPDGNNRDVSLRARPLIGAQMLSGFRKSRIGWRGGKIYNPANGKTYRSSIRLKTTDQLLVKGCVGPFCQSQRWSRVRKQACSN